MNEYAGYEGPYLKRSGVDALEIVEKLTEPPEFSLSDEERGEAYAFENQLYEYQIRDGHTIEDILRRHQDERTIAPQFFPEANEEILTPAQLRALAKESAEFFKKEVADAIVTGEPVDEAILDHDMIALDPQKVMAMMEDITSVRQYLLELRRQYKEPHQGGTSLDGAKRSLVDIYLAKVNTFVASSMVSTDVLIRQSERIDDEVTATTAKELLSERMRGPDVVQRLDYLRNGMGLTSEGGHSAVSHTLEASTRPSVEQIEARFTTEERQTLGQTMLEPDDIVIIMSAILDRAGMLSSEPSETWNPDRSNRAEDGLFQVVKNPSAATFAVDGRSGVYKAPTEARSLYDLLIIGGFHELEHINQAQADVLLGQHIRLARLRGKRIGMLAESGANVEHQAAEKEWFGISTATALTYPKALQVLEAGGSLLDAAHAFYEEKRQLTPDLSSETVAREAADRVLRLIRGGRSSLSLSYAEGDAFVEGLADADETLRQRAGSITSFDFVDQLRLHKYGLIPEGSEAIDWSVHIEAILQPLIDEALSPSIEDE